MWRCYIARRAAAGAMLGVGASSGVMLGVGASSSPSLADGAASPVRVQGIVAPGWEGVRDAFSENFERRGELGASCCIVWRGEVVVDIWGGTRNGDKPWERDTITNVFSATKGIVALAVSVLIDRGKLDIAERVSKYWPELTAAGKRRHG